MDLSSRGPKNPVCKFSRSYDDRYYIDFMVRTDPRITEGHRHRQRHTHTHPHITARVSVETYSPRGNRRVQKYHNSTAKLQVNQLR